MGLRENILCRVIHKNTLEPATMFTHTIRAQDYLLIDTACSTEFPDCVESIFHLFPYETQHKSMIGNSFLFISRYHSDRWKIIETLQASTGRDFQAIYKSDSDFDEKGIRMIYLEKDNSLLTGLSAQPENRAYEA